MITDWQKKKVAILGFGIEGLSSAQFLREKGAGVWILDRKQKEKILITKWQHTLNNWELSLFLAKIT